MKKDWLVYKVSDSFKGCPYVKVLQSRYKERLKLKGRRDIIKNNLSFKEADTFADILNKLKK